MCYIRALFNSFSVACDDATNRINGVASCVNGLQMLLPISRSSFLFISLLETTRSFRCTHFISLAEILVVSLLHFVDYYSPRDLMFRNVWQPLVGNLKGVSEIICYSFECGLKYCLRLPAIARDCLDSSGLWCSDVWFDCLRHNICTILCALLSRCHCYDQKKLLLRSLKMIPMQILAEQTWSRNLADFNSMLQFIEECLCLKNNLGRDRIKSLSQRTEKMSIDEDQKGKSFSLSIGFRHSLFWPSISTSIPSRPQRNPLHKIHSAPPQLGA